MYLLVDWKDFHQLNQVEEFQDHHKYYSNQSFEYLFVLKLLELNFQHLLKYFISIEYLLLDIFSFLSTITSPVTIVLIGFTKFIDVVLSRCVKLELIIIFIRFDIFL